MAVLAFGGPADAAQLQRAIVGGTSASQASPVVRVEDQSRGAQCSGVLIAPRVVLTAKHCVQPPLADLPAAPEALRVGGFSGDGALWLSVASLEALPGSYRPAPEAAADLAGADLAVLVLTAPAQEARAAPLGFVAPMPGDALRAVGFGQLFGEQPASAGTRREAPVEVLGVRDDLLATTPAACDGDSGGALFDASGQLVAVISTRVGSCAGGETQATLLAAGARLIDAAFCQTGVDCTAQPPPPRTAGGCTVGTDRSTGALIPCCGLFLTAWVRRALRYRRRVEVDDEARV